MDFPVRSPNATRYRSSSFYRRHRQRIWVGLVLILVLETLHHVSTFKVRRPSKPLDQPFATKCQEPTIHGRRENAVIVMLARNSDLHSAARSYNYPYVFLNDVPWDQSFIDEVSRATKASVNFEVIPKDMWGYPEYIDQKKARTSMNKQQANRIMYGGSESYHHMCRFNSG